MFGTLQDLSQWVCGHVLVPVSSRRERFLHVTVKLQLVKGSLTYIDANTTLGLT